MWALVCYTSLDLEHVSALLCGIDGIDMAGLSRLFTLSDLHPFPHLISSSLICLQDAPCLFEEEKAKADEIIVYTSADLLRP